MGCFSSHLDLDPDPDTVRSIWSKRGKPQLSVLDWIFFVVAGGWNPPGRGAAKHLSPPPSLFSSPNVSHSLAGGGGVSPGLTSKPPLGPRLGCFRAAYDCPAPTGREGGSFRSAPPPLPCPKHPARGPPAASGLDSATTYDICSALRTSAKVMRRVVGPRTPTPDPPTPRSSLTPDPRGMGCGMGPR